MNNWWRNKQVMLNENLDSSFTLHLHNPMIDQLFVPRPFCPQLNQKSSLNTFRRLLEAGRHFIDD